MSVKNNSGQDDNESKVNVVMQTLVKDLDKDQTLSPEQKNNVVTEMKDNVKKLIKAGIEPTEKMVKTIQRQQVKSEQNRTNSQSKSASLSH